MSYHIVILGAGAIGCHFGATIAADILAENGHVTLIGRETTIAPMQKAALTIDNKATAKAVTFTSDPAAMKDADLIVLALKSHALDAAIEQIETFAQPETPILSLLNGIAPVRTLQERLGARRVLAGMVPFNVVWTSPTELHRSGPGEIALERHEITVWLKQLGHDFHIADDLAPIQYGKLLLNLINPINALAGIPLHDMLSDRGYRRIFAEAIAEALAVYDTAGITWEQVGPSSPRLALKVMRLPNWLFRKMVLNKQNLDRNSMTSMASDLAAGKPTEIDTINGEIVRLGQLHNLKTPINTSLVALVKQAEASSSPPKLAASRLLQDVGL
ncbi:2-dehydropantoate 2-reductase [Planktotalea sp.]|uniref:2-dehydropantoate 2-reductase n=1 Tax=Planktotalea sp. TaxID=2029877 RepID=UPI003D6AE3AF